MLQLEGGGIEIGLNRSQFLAIARGSVQSLRKGYCGREWSLCGERGLGHGQGRAATS